MADDSTSWIQYTGTAVLSILASIVAMTLRFGSVARDAKDAMEKAETGEKQIYALEARLRAVEGVGSLNSQAISAMGLTLNEIRADVRELLANQREHP